MTRFLTGLIIAAIFISASLPARGALWSTLLIGLSTLAALLRGMQREREPANPALLKLILACAFVGCASYFCYNSSIHKYGFIVIYLLAIATYASLRSRDTSSKEQITLCAVTIFIASAWFAHAVVQALYELRTVGGLTTIESECASALAKVPLTLAWILTIRATELSKRSQMERLMSVRRSSHDALTRWLFLGSFVVAIALGVTQWRDWQVQTACF